MSNRVTNYVVVFGSNLDALLNNSDTELVVCLVTASLVCDNDNNNNKVVFPKLESHTITTPSTTRPMFFGKGRELLPRLTNNEWEVTITDLFVPKEQGNDVDGVSLCLHQTPNNCVAPNLVDPATTTSTNNTNTLSTNHRNN